MTRDQNDAMLQRAKHSWIHLADVLNILQGVNISLTLIEIAKPCIIANLNHMSRDVRKPDFCICENKDADQLRGNREADQRLCFRYTDSTIPLLPNSEISSL